MNTIQNLAVREQAYLLLRRAIVEGALGPGQRIVEDALAETYGVSRTPLREALHKLEQEGLLERLPRRGLAVSELSIRELTELYEVRSHLEGLAAKLTTQRQTPEQTLLFQSYLEKTPVLWGAGGAGSDAEQFKQDLLKEFHRNLVAWCGNAICLDFLYKMETRIKRYVYIGMLHQDRPRQAFQEHLDMVRAVLARDAEGVERAMRAHISNGLASCDAYIAARAAERGA